MEYLVAAGATIFDHGGLFADDGVDDNNVNSRAFKVCGVFKNLFQHFTYVHHNIFYTLNEFRFALSKIGTKIKKN